MHKKCIRRVWTADEVNDIEENGNLLQSRLFSVGVQIYVSTKVEDMKKRVDFLEQDADVEKVSRSFFSGPGYNAPNGCCLLCQKQQLIASRLDSFPRSLPQWMYVMSEANTIAFVVFH